MNLSAIILAGGESRRMGRDKAWVLTDGQPLIARAVRTLGDAGITEIFISGRAGTDYSALGCPVLLDREPGSGPLSGIERALEATEAHLTLVLAVDLPRMTAAFLQTLIQRCDRLVGVVPELKAHLEPLAAIYPKGCHFIAQDCLSKRRLAVRDFAEACRHEQAVTIFPVPQNDVACFENWNFPIDISELKYSSEQG